MPLTQNAPREPGCLGFGAIFMTLSSWVVRSEPHSAAHSQQVLGTIFVAASFADRFEGRTFIAISSCRPRLYGCNASASGDSARGEVAQGGRIRQYSGGLNLLHKLPLLP